MVDTNKTDTNKLEELLKQKEQITQKRDALNKEAIEKIKPIQQDIINIDAEIKKEKDKNKQILQQNRDKAFEEINKLRQQAYDLIKQCEAIADESGCGFSWDIAYGMGGYYNPRKPDKLDESKYDPDSGEWSESDGGWASSSSNC